MRVVLQTWDMPSLSGDFVAVRVVNEGAEDFVIRKEDLWTALMGDGRRVVLERLTVPSEKPAPRRRVVKPLHSEDLSLSPRAPIAGAIAAIELQSADLKRSIVASEPFSGPKVRLQVPPELPAAFEASAESQTVHVAIVVGAEGGVESVVPVQGKPPRKLLDVVRAAILKWRIDPARQKGVSQRSILDNDFQFSDHRVVRRTFGLPESALVPSLARYLREVFPWVVEIREAHGFAVAAPAVRNQEGLLSATAWLIRTGEHPKGSWISIGSMALIARDPEIGMRCGCYLWTTDPGAPQRLMDLASARLGLPSVESATFAPQMTWGIPSGLPESPDAGRWERSAVRRLLRVSLAMFVPDKSGSGKEKTPPARPMPAGDLPAASEFPSPSLSPCHGCSVQPPELIKKAQPLYPEVARQARIEGKVVLQATIDTEGNVQDVEVVKKVSGLNLSSVDAVCCWKYKPAMENGKPVQVTFTVIIDYFLSSLR